MKIEIHLLSQSSPIQFNDVKNAYTKDGLYCLEFTDHYIKFPFCNIYRIKELK